MSDLPEIGGGGGRGASMSCIHTSCMMYIIRVYYYISCTPTRVISILCIVYIISNMMRKRISLPLFLYTYIYIYLDLCFLPPAGIGGEPHLRTHRQPHPSLSLPSFSKPRAIERSRRPVLHRRAAGADQAAGKRAPRGRGRAKKECRRRRPRRRGDGGGPLRS